MTASGSTPAGVVPQDTTTGGPASASAATPPATPPTTNPSTPIRRQTPAAQASSAEAAAPTSLLGGTSDIVRLVGALGMVLALIFAAQWAGKRLLGQQRGGRSSRVINVLSRTILAPRQQVILVSVGRRLLVVGDSAGRLTPLAEITDLEEVAELLAESRGEKAAASGAFNEWMNKNQRNFLAEDEIDDPALAPAVSSSAAESLENPQIKDLSQVSDLSPAKVGDLAGLLEKVRGVKRSFKS
jgi:flagellar protein FliO/FliZ